MKTMAGRIARWMRFGGVAAGLRRPSARARTARPGARGNPARGSGRRRRSAAARGTRCRHGRRRPDRRRREPSIARWMSTENPSPFRSAMLGWRRLSATRPATGSETARLTGLFCTATADVDGVGDGAEEADHLRLAPPLVGGGCRITQSAPARAAAAGEGDLARDASARPRSRRRERGRRSARRPSRPARGAR